MNKCKRNWTKILFNIVVLSVFFAFFAKNISIKVVWRFLNTGSYNIYFFTVILSVFRIWLTGIRWELLHPENLNKLHKWSYFRFSMLSHFYNLFMPGALGGDIVRMGYVLHEQKMKKIKSVIAVFVDRIIGLFSILIFGLLALLFVQSQIGLNHNFFVSVSVILIAFFFIVTSRKIILNFERVSKKNKLTRGIISKIITNWREAVDYYSKHPQKVGFSLLICIPIHFISFFIFYLFGKQLELGLDFYTIIFSISIMWLITTLPISIGGIGVREVSLVWLLGMFGIKAELAIALSFMNYINTLIVSFLAIPLLFNINKNNPKRVSKADSFIL